MIVDGKSLAEKIAEGLKREIADMKNKGVVPTLGVIFVENGGASKVYVAKKKEKAESLGMGFVEAYFADVSEFEVIEKIRQWNVDKNVHGIMVQLPLPKTFDTDKVIESIDPSKDVDGLTSKNVGRLSKGLAGLYPATPLGVMEILKASDVNISGKNAVIVGRSNLVGKPLAQMLLTQNATVTLAHSKTEDLAALTKQADILVSAAGVPSLISADMVKNGAVVIDVATTLKDCRLQGDVDFESVKDRSSLITPVPGGVGPLTVIMLMKNVIYAAKQITEGKSLLFKHKG